MALGIQPFSWVLGISAFCNCHDSMQRPFSPQRSQRTLRKPSKMRGIPAVFIEEVRKYLVRVDLKSQFIFVLHSLLRRMRYRESLSRTIPPKGWLGLIQVFTQNDPPPPTFLVPALPFILPLSLDTWPGLRIAPLFPGRRPSTGLSNHRSMKILPVMQWDAADRPATAASQEAGCAST